MNSNILELEIEQTNDALGVDRWMVVLFNNDTNTFDEVIETLIVATGCDGEEAYIEAWEAHTYGKAPVHYSSQNECDEVAAILNQVGLKTEVCQEWPD